MTSRLLFYLPVAPVLVAFHAMAVIEGDGAVLTNSIEAEFSGVQWISRPDVLSPAKRENLSTTGKSNTFSFMKLCIMSTHVSVSSVETTLIVSHLMRFRPSEHLWLKLVICILDYCTALYLLVCPCSFCALFQTSVQSKLSACRAMFRVDA